jgi:hypothetical protein
MHQTLIILCAVLHAVLPYAMPCCCQSAAVATDAGCCAPGPANCCGGSATLDQPVKVACCAVASERVCTCHQPTDPRIVREPTESIPLRPSLLPALAAVENTDADVSAGADSAAWLAHLSVVPPPDTHNRRQALLATWRD